MGTFILLPASRTPWAVLTIPLAPERRSCRSDPAQPNLRGAWFTVGESYCAFKVCILERISFWLSTPTLSAHLDRTKQAGDLSEPFSRHNPHPLARVLLPCPGEYWVLTQLLKKQYLLSHLAVAFCKYHSFPTQEPFREKDRVSGLNWSVSLFGFPRDQTPEMLI